MNTEKPARQLAVRIAMMPRDINGQGTISGGVLLCHIDLAAAIVARSACASMKINRMVTRAMDKVEFTRPVQVDDILSCYGRVTRIGNTSVTVHVEVEVEREGSAYPVTEATAVFVALDDDGKPTPVCGGKTKCHEAPEATAQPANPPAPAAVAPSPVVPALGERVVALRKFMLPAETNGMGNIFGGLLLTYMDMAGHYTARQACKNRIISRCVTRLMDKIEFKEPVHVNDIITCYGVITKVGRTSITVHIDVEAERHGQVIQVTQADLVFVAVDMAGRPVPVCLSGQSVRSPLYGGLLVAMLCTFLGSLFLFWVSLLLGSATMSGALLGALAVYLLMGRGKLPGQSRFPGHGCGCEDKGE